MSAATEAALHRVGAGMGAAEGTGPDDDPWLRHYRDEIRTRGGPVRVGHRRPRGTRHPTAPGLPASIAEPEEIPVTVLVRAALRSASESEFLEFCASERRR